MLVKTLLCGIAAATMTGGVALAQTAAAPAPAAPADPAAQAAPAPATTNTSEFRPGAEVKDSSGGLIGTVVKAGAATNGQVAVVVDIDGKQVSLPANLFTVADSGIVSSVTKAQIQAAMPKG